MPTSPGFPGPRGARVCISAQARSEGRPAPRRPRPLCSAHAGAQSRPGPHLCQAQSEEQSASPGPAHCTPPKWARSAPPGPASLRRRGLRAGSPPLRPRPLRSRPGGSAPALLRPACARPPLLAPESPDPLGVRPAIPLFPFAGPEPRGTPRPPGTADILGPPPSPLAQRQECHATPGPKRPGLSAPIAARCCPPGPARAARPRPLRSRAPREPIGSWGRGAARELARLWLAWRQAELAEARTLRK